MKVALSTMKQANKQKTITFDLVVSEQNINI
jgi:hypothetical protein